jgi:hypothetical protein
MFIPKNIYLATAGRKHECGLSNRTLQGAGSILQSSNHRLECIRKAASPEAVDHPSLFTGDNHAHRTTRYCKEACDTRYDGAQNQKRRDQALDRGSQQGKEDVQGIRKIMQER